MAKKNQTRRAAKPKSSGRATVRGPFPAATARQPFDHVRAKGVRHTKVYVPGWPLTPAIHVGDERYTASTDGSIMVPADQLKDFIKMGCTNGSPA